MYKLKYLYTPAHDPVSRCNCKTVNQYLCTYVFTYLRFYVFIVLCIYSFMLLRADINTSSCKQANTVLCTYLKSEIFFKRKLKNRKKEKESNFTGRDAGRQKGIGISPGGWFVRNEQNIMPKSFCQTVQPVISSVSFFIS